MSVEKPHCGGIEQDAQPRLLVLVNSEQERTALSGALEPLRRRWNLQFAEEIRVLSAVEEHPPAAVILKEPIPGSVMARLIEHFPERCPSAVRLVRCREGGHPLPTLEATEVVQIAFEPDPVAWEAVARRAVMMHSWLRRDRLKRLMGSMHKLPAVPTVYTRVLKELESPTATFEFLAEVIATDPLMTAKMLQMVNSAYFGLAQRITSPVEAVLHLGMERVKSVILLAHMFSEFDNTQVCELGIDQLWDHCLETGDLAQAIARQEGCDEALVGLAFTAGLLHDVGKLLLAGNLPEEYGRVLHQARAVPMKLHEAEMTMLGASHAELGGVLLATWGLPLDLVEAAGWHHTPEQSGDSSFSVLTAVHVANTLVHEQRQSSHLLGCHEINASYLNKLSLEAHEDRWRQACGLLPIESAELS